MNASGKCIQSHWTPDASIELMIVWIGGRNGTKRPVDVIDVGKKGEHPSLRDMILARYRVTIHA